MHNKKFNDQLMSAELLHRNAPAGVPQRARITPVATPRGRRRPDGRRNRIATAARRLRADLLDVVGWASVAMTIVVYLSDHGLSAWGSLAGSVKQVGVLTGLVAADLMVLSFLLASRIPFVDRAIGHDKALERHGGLGGWVLSLVLVHGLFTTTAYALSDKLNLFSEFASLWGFGDYALAVVAAGLLVLVAVSSIVLSVRRRLPQELWHGVHLTTYAAMVLSIPHQFSMDDLFTHGFARWYWIGMYAVTAFCLLCFRVLYPLTTSLEHQLVVSGVQRLSPDSVAITMTGKHLDQLDAEAGQFFHWRFMTPKLWWHQHPFSLSAAPDGRSLRVTVRALGKGTAQITRTVKPGDKVWVEGPYGLFSTATRTRDALVLVGAGAGIGPVVSLLEEADTIPGRALVVLRASTPADLLHYDEVHALCARRGIQLVTLVGHRGPGSRWLPASSIGSGDGLLAWAPWLQRADVFVCGPAAWTDEVVAEARAEGLADEQLHFERFSW